HLVQDEAEVPARAGREALVLGEADEELVGLLETPGAQAGEAEIVQQVRQLGRRRPELQRADRVELAALEQTARAAQLVGPLREQAAEHPVRLPAVRREAAGGL